MSLTSWAGPVAAATGLLLVVLAAAAAAIKAWRERRGSRRDATARRLRPIVLGLASGTSDGVDGAGLDGRDASALERGMLDVLPLLRGEDRATLVRALESRGVVDRARRATYSWSRLARAEAAETLGVCATQRALPELGRLLRDRDPEVRIVATRALGRLGGAGAVPFLLASLERPRAVPTSIVGMALTHVGPVAADGLREGLRAPSSATRAVSATMLGQFGVMAATDDLVTRLDDPDDQVRASAAQALGRIGAPRAVDPLLAALAGDPSAEVRRSAVTALGDIGIGRAATGVAVSLDAASSDLAWPAARALSRLGEPGRAELVARGTVHDLTGAYAREALAESALRR